MLGDNPSVLLGKITFICTSAFFQPQKLSEKFDHRVCSRAKATRGFQTASQEFKSVLSCQQRIVVKKLE